MITASGPRPYTQNLEPLPKPLVFDPPPTIVQPQSFSDQLNALSTGVLDRLAQLGEPFQPSVNSSPFGVAPEIAEKASILESVGEKLGSAKNFLLRTGLQSANAFFGATSILGQFSEEHQAGSVRYEKTLKRTAIGVLQGSLNTAIGIAAAGGVAAIGVVGAPAILIGGGVAIGASYLSNAAINAYLQN